MRFACRCLGTSEIQREERDGTDPEHQYREGYRIVIEPMVGLNSHVDTPDNAPSGRDSLINR